MMRYKEDWPDAKQRLIAWWNHEIIDRCCIAVHAPRRTSSLPPFPDLQHGPWLGGLESIADDDVAAIRDWWVDPESNVSRATTWFENNYFGGEALPIAYVNWGAMALAGVFGARTEFMKTTVWYEPTIEDWAQWTWLEDPQGTDTWTMLVRIVEALLEGADGNYFVGKPELGNGADVLSLMRGVERLSMDLYDASDQVARGVEVISDAWVRLMEDAYQRTSSVNDAGDVLAWMGLWAPGRTDQIACDFSISISPDMMRRFFLPEIVKMSEWCEYGVYHLDGQAAIMNHLDTLLGVPGIRTIQFTPGFGSPPTLTADYLPRYRRILESGRQLYLLAQPDEVRPLIRELGPEGLFIRTYVGTQEEAETLLANVTHWSGSGNVFPVT